MIRLIRFAANMRFPTLLAGVLLLISGSSAAQDAASPPKPADAENAQKPAVEPAAVQPIPISQAIKKESRLVLVDAIVTDKKGHYVHDLTQGDFKLYEDNKEQSITSFSTGANAGGPDWNPRQQRPVRATPTTGSTICVRMWMSDSAPWNRCSQRSC